MEQKHKWSKVDVPPGDKDTFKLKYICMRGDCCCYKLISYSGIVIYGRGKIYGKTEVMTCYGDTPLNDQTIDE